MEGCVQIHVYVWEHTVSPYFRIAWLLFTKHEREEVLIAQDNCLDFRPVPPWVGSRAGQN